MHISYLYTYFRYDSWAQAFQQSLAAMFVFYFVCEYSYSVDVMVRHKIYGLKIKYTNEEYHETAPKTFDEDFMLSHYNFEMCQRIQQYRIIP